MVDVGLYISYILMAVALLGAVVLPLIKSFDNPGSLKKGIFGIVGIVVVFGIAYALSGNEVTPIYEKFGVTPSGSKLWGACLITLYLLGIASILSIVYSEVTKFFK